MKAPYGSTLEVPDPDEGMPPGRRRFEIQLSSRTGPIDVFLIQDANDHPSSDSLHSNGVADGAGPDGLAMADGNLDESLLKHFDFPQESYNFELKPGEGIQDLYGFNDDVFNSMFHAP